MTILRFAPLALLALSSPAFAHQGTIHGGCPGGQTFTAGGITVTDAFSRAMLAQAKVGAGYMTIANSGAAPDKLVGVTTEATDKVELHNMAIKDGMMTMSAAEDGIEVPAGGTVTLGPGGLHIMFVEPHAAFKEGECVAVVLKFATAGELPVQLVVGPVGADTMPMEMDHSQMDMGTETPKP